MSSSEGTTAVDVNSINPDMIERVEIITGANSAVYGADAVAGAVNFILKENFSGLQRVKGSIILWPRLRRQESQVTLLLDAY